MQQLLLAMLALLSAIGIASGGSSGSSGFSLGGKGSDDDDFGSGNGNNNGDNGGLSDRDTDLTLPTPPVQDVDTSGGGGTEPVDASSGSYSVNGGRVTTLGVQDAQDAVSVRIIEGPSVGTLTVNPDNTLALVLSNNHGFSGNFNIRYEVSYNDGSSEEFSDTVTVHPSTQDDGWGEGHFYMLETDESGELIVEAGGNHREVYVSNSSDALSRADIAAMEGLSTSQITNDWLSDHPEYGGSPELAFNPTVGVDFWDHVAGRDAEPSSNWLLFERGYEYDLTENFDLSGAHGEDPLHPIHITAYGDGPKPVIDSRLFAIGESLDYVVISDLELPQGMTVLDGQNFILDNVDISDDSGTALVIQGFDGIVHNATLHNSTITDVYLTEPEAGSSGWEDGNPFTAGAYIATADGILIQNTFFDHNGFAPDYREDMSTEGGQPPQMFNHNLYLQHDTTDVTLRDSIIMRGASFGAQARGGAFMEDNIMIDNNIATTFVGGDHNGIGPIGNFTLFSGNVITSAGYHTADSAAIGATAGGMWENGGLQSTLIDNIVAHMADPDNPTEQAEKVWAQWALRHTQDPYYDDTIVHNWVGPGTDSLNTTGINTQGLDAAVMDSTTIQRFAQQLLGDPNAGIPELANAIRAQAFGEFDDVIDADLIISFFQAGFGVAVEGRLGGETLRFVPDDLGDGIRWDNRLNWDTNDLPGTPGHGDSVDLGGNYVTYGGTTTIQDLDFGEGGELTVTHGRLTIQDHTAVGEAGGELNISDSGQVWMDGYTDRDELDLNITGGRFVNTGIFNGHADIDIYDGQVILATAGSDFIMRNGTRMEIHGDEAEVGFGDDSGTAPAVMLMDTGSDLVFTAQDGEIGYIGEVNDGRWEGNVQSGINLGGGELELNLSGLSNGTHRLINVNEIIGEFGEVDVNGLGSRNATINVDYETDRVELVLSSGSGNVTVNTIGDEDDAQANADLWDALTNGHGIYPDDPTSSIVHEEDDMDEAA